MWSKAGSHETVRGQHAPFCLLARCQKHGCVRVAATTTAAPGRRGGLKVHAATRQQTDAPPSRRKHCPRPSIHERNAGAQQSLRHAPAALDSPSSHVSFAPPGPGARFVERSTTHARMHAHAVPRVCHLACAGRSAQGRVRLTAERTQLSLPFQRRSVVSDFRCGKLTREGNKLTCVGDLPSNTCGVCADFTFSQTGHSQRRPARRAGPGRADAPGVGHP